MPSENQDPYRAIAAQDLIVRSWNLIDLHDGRGVEELFTKEGVLAFGDSVHRGRDEIRAVYDDRRSRGPRVSRHVVTNFLFQDTGESIAARYIMTLFAADGEPVLDATIPIAVMDVNDEIVYGSGCWNFQYRHMRNVFRAAGQPLAVPYSERPSTNNFINKEAKA